ncbi:esterase/lipase family protein [Teredinibacter purpureus]|uniref:esterase/lipase family protein n=1 Tax=Teredinibacter purpureus TaxID=2731756 RepID=UPI000A970075|nr:alpha/beta fold hydrolase [Teredinibacter purpureus]
MKCYSYWCVFLFLLMATHARAECIILLHGLARTDSSMHTLEKHLKQSGYQTINQPYASRSASIVALSESAITQAVAQCTEDTKINFVTHSLGGILVRQYLAKNTLKRLHRVVMLGPPNKGSEVVDKLKMLPGYSFINGKAGQELGTESDSVPNSLGPVTFKLGVIAGNRSINLILSWLIPGEDDGKVSIINTKVEGMSDHIVLPVTHTFMMKNKQVIAQTIHYIQHGYFKKMSVTN